ncbi:glycosyltransferase [Desulfonauticus submarinus]
MHKLKILLGSETYPPNTNGAAIFVHRLANNLAKFGHQVMVVAPSPKFKDIIQKKNKNLTIYRIKSISLKPVHPYFRVISKINLQNTIEKIVKDFQPDIIHIHNHFLVGRTCLAVAKKRYIPIIGTNHFMPDNLLEYFPKFVEEELKKYMWKDFLKVYNKLDYVTAPSKAAVKMIVDLGLKVPTKVISNGIDLRRFSPHKPDKNLYKKYNIDPSLPTFVFVGRLERDKNIDLILKALKIVLKTKKVQVIIVGKGRDENKFKNLSEELHLKKWAIFTGKVPNDHLYQLYNLADVYIGSGTAELQGLAVMEAMASGLPILAVNAVALPELVKNGLNGYLFEPNEFDLAEKMVKILNNKEDLKQMAQKSLEIIKEHDEIKTVRSFIDLYKQVISLKSK